MVNQNMVKGALAVVALSAIVLMGLAVVEGFSKEFRDTGSAINTTLTLGAMNVSEAVGTTGQFPYLQTMDQCINASNETGYPDLLTTNFTIDEGTSNGGTVLLDGGAVEWVGESVNCTLTYLADSALQAEADKFSTGLGIFGSFIGVVVLAILGMFIMNMFRRKKD